MHLYAQICKVSLHICNLDFEIQIYIILGYKWNCANKKKYAVLNIQALKITIDG